MHISWLGQTCVKLQTKFKDEDVVVVVDAYRPASGDFPRSLSPSTALFSNGQTDAITLSQDPFVIDTLGEFESQEVLMQSFPGGRNNLIFKIAAEGINIVHLGRLNTKMDIADLEKLGSIDILLIPVGGGKDYLSPSDAAELTTALEPRIVIPIAYACDSDKSARPVSEFIKELGVKPTATDKKFIIKKKDLPAEEMQLYVLEKNI